MKYFFLSSVFYCLTTSCFCQESKTFQQKWKLVWSDEFDYNGLPDSSKWDYDVRDKWFNNELQYYTRSDTNNAIVHNGYLHIIALKTNKENHSYTSTRLITKNKGDWTNGKIEIRAKLPAGRGLWPAIWMLPTDGQYGNWPKSGEIDIMENVGFKPDSVFFSIHTEAFNHVIGTQKTKGIKIMNPYTDFHVYAIEWNQNKIDFLLDDNIVFTYANSGNGYKEWPFDKRFYLILNIAVGGDWGGKEGIDDTVFPTSMLVDYVRVYQKK